MLQGRAGAMHPAEPLLSHGPSRALRLPPGARHVLEMGLPAAGQVPTGLLPRDQQAGGGEAGGTGRGLGRWPAPCSS